MNNKNKVLVAAIIAVALLLAIGGTLLLAGGASGRERSNMLALAREYIDRGDYDRALDLLDRLIIKDVNDQEARALRDEALARKSGGARFPGAASGQAHRGLPRPWPRAWTSWARASSARRAPSPPAAPRSPASAQGSDADAAAAARKAEEEARAKAEAEAEAARKRAQDEALAEGQRGHPRQDGGRQRPG